MERNIFQVVWFVLWGVLWTGYFVLDGFDLGAGLLLPKLAGGETHKRMVYNAIGPFWDANEVWLITAGGATFAAFPRAYAIMFSGLYAALLLLLFCLIFRGVALEFRSKEEDPLWRKRWDTVFTLSSLLATVLLGVAFANIFKGLPVDGKGIIHGGIFSLLNPYGILGGVLFVLMFAVHGASWVYYRATGELEERARALALKLWPFEFIMAALFLAASIVFTNLWNNYFRHPVLFVFPFLAIAGLVLTFVFLRSRKALASWLSSALTIIGAVAWGLAGLFPNLLPSSISPAYSVTVYNSSSSPLTLKVMTAVAFMFVPIMLAYKFWVYKNFSGKLTEEDVYGEKAY